MASSRLLKALAGALSCTLSACASTPQQSGDTAAAAVEELLATDRRFAAAAQRSRSSEEIAAAFDQDVIVNTGRTHLRGRDSARVLMRRGPIGTPYWEPVRGGVSADGTNGFTFGYLSVHSDTATTRMKYLAYWTKGADGWQVRVYRRTAASGAPASVERMAPSIPALWGAAFPDAGEAGRGVREAESAFSARAGVVGLREAFREYGTPDAMNMGGPGRSGFVIGADAIAEVVSEGAPPGPSALTWGSDQVIVAGSGDLGVSIGYINIPGPPAARVPFFTIWRRDGVGRPWRYIAE